MYEYIKKISNINMFNISNLEENIRLIIYSTFVFFLPFMLGHPQFLVGTLVNSALILSAVYLKNYKLLPIIMLPSLGVLSKGLIFGPFTVFLIYMIPFIWIGNAILVFSHKLFYVKNKINYFFSLAISAALKTAFLFTAAFVFVKFSVLPALFLTTMGMMQLYTAIAGGVIAYSIVKAKEIITA